MRDVKTGENGMIYSLFQNKSGAAMMEYAVILGVILAVSLGVFLTIGTKLDIRFRAVANGICSEAVGC